ncbi:MAG: phosphoribosylformylglycinamidine synthase subunit PurQ [Desulfovibrio sp.]|jgi:phosphoribosylformylglycinamidine synthase|nr:phosphoribosylformylglycinamidine synthase subunit PurQ [Desulfovibrio sp.]
MKISTPCPSSAKDSARALVITGYGVNCEKECAYAARAAGAAVADIAYFSDLVEGRRRIADYNFIIFPGGFLDGDDLGAAQAAAQRWKYAVPRHGAPFPDQLLALVEKGGLILGICNGFQLLVKLGLLPALGNKYLERQISLTHNASARFEDRWCRLRVNRESPCVFTDGLDSLYMPVRHGEGRIVAADEALLRRLHAENLTVLYYADEHGLPTQDYPDNPNGSPLGIAGLCDPSGRIFGLMPHPEAYNHPTNHPGWTRGESAASGLNIFARAVRRLGGGRPPGAPELFSRDSVPYLRS